MKGPFCFCPLLRVLFWILEQEEEKPELMVRAHNGRMGFLFSWVVLVCFLVGLSNAHVEKKEISFWREFVGRSSHTLTCSYLL